MHISPRTRDRGLPLRPRAPALPASAAALAEHVEKLAWRDMVAAAEGELARQLGLRTETYEGAVVLRARKLDSLLFNRVIGLGTTHNVTDASVRSVIGGYLERGLRRFWIHVCETHRASIGHQLERQGLMEYPRAWMKFLRDTAPFTARPTPLTVRSARAEDATEVAAIVGPAFDLTTPGGEIFGALIGRPQWDIYVVSDADRIVAAGGLYVSGPLGYHAFAATLPSDRNRGAQSLLMQSRIERARARGCKWIATETGAPRAADEPNPSYQNMLRSGFEPVGLRANYGLPGTTWR